MTFAKTVWIYCDYPDCNEFVGSDWGSLPMARRQVRDKGWISVRNPKLTLDYCPDHAIEVRAT
jgi:hypothetical protein